MRVSVSYLRHSWSWSLYSLRQWTPLVLAGPFDVSVLQLACKGRCFDKVLPCLLLRVCEDALRYTPEEVPEVQRRLRGQRFPPHLHWIGCSLIGPSRQRLIQLNELIVRCRWICCEECPVVQILHLLQPPSAELPHSITFAWIPTDYEAS